MTVWSSNDHPTDSWLIGQMLREGQSLTENVSATIRGRLAAYIGSDPPQLYHQLRSDNDEIQNKSTYTTLQNGSIDKYASSSEIPHLSFSLSPASLFLSPTPTMQFMRLESDGNLRRYGWVFNFHNLSVRSLLLFTPLEDCSYPMVCGVCGFCSDGVCSAQTSSISDQLMGGN